MKRLSLTVVVTLAAVSFVLGQVSDTKKVRAVEQELLQLKLDWGKAYVQRDAVLLDRILADDFVVVDADGAAATKMQEMADFKSSSVKYESSNYDDATVRVYGDTAIVSGRGTVKGRGKTQAFHMQYRSTNVFVKRNGRWQAVASHISGVKNL